MSAPALILLAQGTIDFRVEQVYHTLRHQLQIKRPALSIHLASADTCPPTGPQVAGRSPTAVSKRSSWCPWICHVFASPADRCRKL